MPRKKNKKKYYLVLSKSRNYTYGAFPYTEEGEKLAQIFAKKYSKEKDEELYVVGK
jgi:hypothetical protein